MSAVERGYVHGRADPSRTEHVMRADLAILISHRVSTVKDADEIVVMDHGQIVERGDHDALLAHGGYYAELHQRQLLEEELEVSE